MRLKRWHWIVIGVIAFLITIRAILPVFVVRYVNEMLAGIEDYEGSISDVDLFLYRGAYKIYDLRLDKVSAKGPTPFLHTPVIDLSVEWKSLLDGAIVGEVEVLNPRS